MLSPLELLLRTLLSALPTPLSLLTPTPALSFTPDQKLIAEAWRTVHDSFLDRTFNRTDFFSLRMKALKKSYSSRSEAYAAIESMVSVLNDPYTRFLRPERYAVVRGVASGEVGGGIGVEFYPGPAEGGAGAGVKIARVFEGGPAERAGVGKGDVVVEVDGERVKGMTAEEVAGRVRGVKGSVVVVVVRNDGNGEERRVEIEREEIKVPSVEWRVERDVGVVRVVVFNTSTGRDVKEAVEKCVERGARKFVLDLRDNPGGYFDGGVEVAKVFLKNGEKVVFVVHAKGEVDEYEVRREESEEEKVRRVTEAKMVVLVNKGTASASEIVAGAMKDNGRAVVVGERTFGKGVVQTLSELSDGSGMAVTVARYETPGHHDINKVGIEPDVVKACPADVKDVLECIPDGTL